MSDLIPVAYWSDPLCIWAFVAQPRLEAVLAHHGARLSLEHHIVPVFGSVPQRFRDGAWAAQGPEGRAAATRRVARQHGREDVSGQVWIDDAPASSWSSGAAVKAVGLLEADERAQPGAMSAYLLAMRRAFFEENRNVGRRREQLALAESLGIDRAPMETLLDDGWGAAALFEDHDLQKAQHIVGSPTWVFDGGRAKLYGNFAEDILHETVRTLVAGLDVGGSAC
jgi:predicted DsbA family dithiol-disulfide isomerase